jgi:Ca2+:H+ antiporter
MTNSPFMLGKPLLGGLRHHTQEYNRVTARPQAGMPFLAAVALLGRRRLRPRARWRCSDHAAAQRRVVGAVAVRVRPRLYFSPDPSRSVFERGAPRRRGRAVAAARRGVVLAVVTVLVALVSEIFVASVQAAAEALA